MKFSRWIDPLLSILYEDDEIIAVDKPYGINTHTNESKAGQAEYVTEGLIEIFEKQLQSKLHIIHRLDQTTTGVIIFGKTLEAAQKYSYQFRNRQVQKNYYFVSDHQCIDSHASINKTIIYKGKELAAETFFTKMKSENGFTLWQANPKTGRNHQIRIHAKEARISILGDNLYDGTVFPFICLHNHKMQFEDGLEIKSNFPSHFQDLKTLASSELSKAYFEIFRRQQLFQSLNKSDFLENQMFRYIHNSNLSFKGKNTKYSLDHFGNRLVLSLYKEALTEFDHNFAQSISSFLNKKLIIRLMLNRGKDAASKHQYFITPKAELNENSNLLESDFTTRWIAQEGSIKYELRSDSGQSMGLFLDQRSQRNWVKNNSLNKSVLNLFSYTCGFSLAAALGGASEVVSVDTSKSVLNWGRKNFEINSLDPDKYKFLNRDSIDYLKKAKLKTSKFDLIICDPPSFSRGEKGVFKIENEIESLIDDCVECLHPGGSLLFSTNFENFFVDDIRKLFLKIKQKRKLVDLDIHLIQSTLDYELPGEGALLKSFLVQLGPKT